MNRFVDTILVLVLSLAAVAQGQYIGSSRPPSRQEMLDSLAARIDTSRFTADSLRLDSLASAGAAKDAALDTRIDSVRDNPASSGGGNVALDTIYYDFVLGFTAEDSIRAGGYSKYIDLNGSIADPDSNDADTLIWCIDQLKTSGGRIYICGTPADTIFWWSGQSFHDSLPTSGGLEKTIVVDGDGRDRVIQWSKQTYNSFQWTENRHAPEGTAELLFRNQYFYGYPGISGAAYKAWTGGAYGRGVRFENCRIVRVWQDCASFDNCVFGTPDTVYYGSVVGHYSFHVRNCTGYFDLIDSRPGQDNIISITDNVFYRCRFIYPGGNNNPGTILLANNVFKCGHAAFMQGGNGYCRWLITGNKFIGMNDGSTTYAIDVRGQWSAASVISGNHFENTGIRYNGGVIISDNGFFSPTTGVHVYGDHVQIHDNIIYNATTGVDVDGNDNCTVRDNYFQWCTTNVSGTPADSSDNYSY